MKNNVSRLILGFVKITGIIPALIFLKPKIHYIDKSKQGTKLPSPCILMSNHQSLLDFVLYLVVFPFRTIRFLMAEVLFNKNKLFSWFLYKIGGIKVDRNAFDFGFIGDSLEVLDKGGTIGIFPESRLPINGVHFPFKPSVVFIALRTDAPIVPVYTDGNYSIFKRANIMIGEKINIKDFCCGDNPSQQNLEELTKILEEKVLHLQKELENRIGK